MSWISDVKHELNILDTSKKKLRQFGILIGSLIIPIIIWLYHPNPIGYIGYILIFISIILILGGIIYPNSLKRVYILWMGLAFIIGWIVSRVLLSVLFLFVLTPLGILGKLFKKEFLNLKFKRGDKSYWIEKDNREIKYDKMF